MGYHGDRQRQGVGYHGDRQRYGVGYHGDRQRQGVGYHGDRQRQGIGYHGDRLNYKQHYDIPETLKLSERCDFVAIQCLAVCGCCHINMDVI